MVPTSLQMGWCKSLAFLCMASETMRDMAQDLWNNTSKLPEYLLEHLCLLSLGTLPNINDEKTQALLYLLKVYINDFISLIQVLQPRTTLTLYPSHPAWHPLHFSTGKNIQNCQQQADHTQKMGTRQWPTVHTKRNPWMAF